MAYAYVAPPEIGRDVSGQFSRCFRKLSIQGWLTVSDTETGGPQIAGPFVRDVDARKLKPGRSKLSFVATAEERTALAEMFNLPRIFAMDVAVEAVSGHWPGELDIAVRLKTRFEQVCVVSLEPFKQKLDLRVSRRYIHGTEGASGPEIEVDADEDAVLPDYVDGDVLPIGDAVVEEFALALDPHPRNPAATFDDHIEAADEGESVTGDNQTQEPGRQNPFAGLDKMLSAKRAANDADDMPEEN